jgi:hypothetical protein
MVTRFLRFVVPLLLLILLGLSLRGQGGPRSSTAPFDRVIDTNATNMLQQGRNTFRFDTFGDEAFWGGMLQLHQAIEGRKLGGVGTGVSLTAALGLGIKVDLDALPQDLVQKLEQGKANLDDPATTFCS